MNWKKTIFLIALVSLVTMVTVGYIKWGKSVLSTSGQTTRPEGWTEETHSNNVAPNYDIVFPQNKVNQIKITIAPSDWEAMQTNMTELLGPRGTGQRGGFPGAPGSPPDGGEMVPDNLTPDGGAAPEFPGLPPDQIEINTGNVTLDNGGAPRAPGIPGRADMTRENPMWTAATVSFNGSTWTNVGIRYKGNSSLRGGWEDGSLKLPLKLDFDEFEDDHPEIENQRFYGFRQLSLSNSFSDSTYMRDVISADLLEEAGLVAAETAYYEVILDYGEGPVNLGLYIMIEVIDDTVIDRVFGDDSGNIYEGDGPVVSLAVGTFDQIKDSFLKENNNQEADWVDIEALYNTLHSEQRSLDPEAWRESLESVFDVDTFLEWLAISAIIENWDSYGQMSHNFYLYNDPESGLLTWISWDHNMVLGVRGGMGGPGGMRAPRGGGRGGITSLGRDEVGQNWPLIRYLLDDPIYYSLYVDYIQKTVDGVFAPEKLETECRQTAALIGSYAVKESGEAAFESAVQELINRIYERYEAANDFLTSEEGN
jgi:spore coat protein H